METEFKEQVTCSEAIVPNHTKYAQYSIREYLPNAIDGLKLVNRRILWTSRNITNKTKAYSLISETMKYLHPHGDASIYGALIRLCQSFTQAYPLVTPYGNVGAIGSAARPAAARYLDVGRSDFTYDLFFARVNQKTLNYIPDELNIGVEPTFLIPIIPFALMTGVNGIGMAFKSEIPMYHFSGICDLTIKYIQNRKSIKFHPKEFYNEFSHYLVPAYPQYSLIRNWTQLQEHYAQGDFNCPIVIDGCMDVYPGKVHLRSIPVGISYPQILEHLKQEKAKPSFISANVNEVANLLAATEVGDIKVDLKRDSDIFNILDQLKKELSFTRSVTPIFNFSDHNGMVYQLTPYLIIEKWYIERYRSVLGDLKITQRDLNNQKREIEAKVIVVDHTDEVTDIVKSSASDDEAVERLVAKFSKYHLSVLQARYILTLSLSQLTRYGRDKLLYDLEVINKKIVEHTEKFQDIDKIIIDDIVWLKEKYANKIPRKCIVPDYIGCLHIKDRGIVQVRSIPELAHQMGRWKKEDPSIELYPYGKSYHYKYLINKGYGEYPLCFPKVFKANDMRTTKYKAKSTIILNDGQIYRMDGITYPKDKSTDLFTPISDSFSAITNKFILEQHEYSEIPKRRQADAFGIKTDMIFVSSVVGPELIVAFYDKKEVNMLHIGKYKIGERLTIPVISKAEIVGIYRPNDPIAITIDDKYLNRCIVKYLYFKDGETLLDGKNHVVVYLNRKTTSNHKSIVEVVKGRDLYGIQRLTKATKTEYDFL